MSCFVTFKSYESSHIRNWIFFLFKKAFSETIQINLSLFVQITYLKSKNRIVGKFSILIFGVRVQIILYIHDKPFFITDKNNVNRMTYHIVIFQISSSGLNYVIFESVRGFREALSSRNFAFHHSDETFTHLNSEFNSIF